MEQQRKLIKKTRTVNNFKTSEPRAAHFRPAF